MIEIVVFFIVFGIAWFGGYHFGFHEGEKCEYKKWYARQWHRPGCSCDGGQKA